jgi:OCT family organic cation transporter-like MFS transporter 4/5
MYVILRGLTGLNCGGVGLSSFVLATEPVGPSRRGQVGMSAFYFFSFGIMTIPAYALWTPSWRWLYVATSAPALLYCALVLPFIWESPRWYLVQGRVQEAMKVLRAFAKRNGKHVPVGVRLIVEEDDDDATEDLNPLHVTTCDESAEDTQKAKCDDDSNANKKIIDATKEKGISDTVKASGTLLDVFRNPATRSRMLIMVVIWFLCAVVYYGITLNVVNLGTNLYVSVFLNALVEMPAFTITALLLDRFGRRWMLASAMFLSGICCLAGSFLFVEPGVTLGTVGAGAQVFKVLRVVCSVIGIFGMAGSYNLIYIYTSELFPTVVRNAALGLTTQMAGIGSIIAPAVVVLGRYNSFLPFAIFGVMAMVGAVLSLGLPETLHQPLFETIQSMQRNEKSRV